MIYRNKVNDSTQEWLVVVRGPAKRAEPVPQPAGAIALALNFFGSFLFGDKKE
jgi:hypothetical protein